MIRERRSISRYDSINLISFVLSDEDNKELRQGMGRTLNISERGIMLETRIPMERQSPISLTIALEEELMDIDGRIAFCNEMGGGVYETGVQFNNPDEEKRRFIRHYIVIFKEQEDSKGVEENV